jgi:hypothetical protein
MGSPASLLLSALLLGALVPGDDAWRTPALEEVLESRIRALADFPAPLYPPDLEDEIAAALEELARLDPDSAASRAHSLLDAAPDESELSWTARRVLAASGDLETVRLGLRSYFDSPGRWLPVLAASDDARLRDFDGGEGEAKPFSERYFLTTIERNLSRARERESIRALLVWAEASADPSSARRVLRALPEGIPLEASVRGWLRRNRESAGPVSPPPFSDGGLPLEIQQRVLALSPDERYAAIRSLAERDQEALLGLPLSRELIDRLYPYFARSSRRAIRDRVRRAESARGRALASLLLSPAAGDAEKREALQAMPDAWAAAVASGGEPIFEVLSKLLPREDLERFLFQTEVDESFLEALAIVPLPEARLRLESLGTPEAVKRLLRRPDRFLSVPALSRLSREGEPPAAQAAALALVSLGGPGASTWLRVELRGPSDPTAVLLALIDSSAPSSAAIVDLARRVASDPLRSPSGFAALARLPLLDLASAGPRALAERVHMAMSLSGERGYLPVLVDLAAGSFPGASMASREAAFSALAEADLGSFAPRLHRLAGDPNREVRVGAAAALVPSGEAWTLRLLLGNLDPSSPREQRIARRAVSRLPRERGLQLLEGMIEDGTAGSIGVLLYLELADETDLRRSRSLQERLWRILAENASAGDRSALDAASRLSHPEAIAVVTGFLSARQVAW